MEYNWLQEKAEGRLKLYIGVGQSKVVTFYGGNWKVFNLKTKVFILKTKCSPLRPKCHQNNVKVAHRG